MPKRPTRPPAILKAGDQWYELAVFKVLTTFEDGTPEECVRIPPDGAAELVGGEEFFTCYVPRVVLRPR